MSSEGKDMRKVLVKLGVVAIMLSLIYLMIRSLPESKAHADALRNGPIPCATVIGNSPDGYDIYEFIHPTTKQRCIIYRHSITILPEK